MDRITIIPRKPLFLAFILFSLQICVQAFNLDSRIPIIKRADRGAYFGYSVAEHQINGGASGPKSQILVGAPRANTSQPGTTRPGTIYVCPVSTRLTDCQQIDLGNFTRNQAPPEDEDANDGWLGVSLKSRGVGGQVVACAHRYKKQDQGAIWGLGMCHLFTPELSYEDPPYEACAGQKTTRGHEDFGFCQAGISSELAEDGTLTVGTPGALNWRGGIFSIAVSRQEGFGLDKRWFSSEMNEYRSFVNKVSYLGMSVTSGYFLGAGKHMVYIAGAPRSNLTGEVFLFRKQVDGKNRTLELLGQLRGEQVASQYGYSLASVDLNKDGYIDLVVGAPFFFQTEPPRGGAVYVYLNSEEGIQYAEPKKLLGPAESKFGFAVANAGDLNLDGYSDLAVGAPYDGAGAVYIFQGSANGIATTEPSQILRATDLPVAGIRTLGYSLSGGIDMDGNGYPDLLTGAYESDAVVLFRARPVINVITEVNELPKYVNDPNVPQRFCTDSSGKNLTCFTFRPCFRIASQNWNFGGEMRIEYRIEAETFQKSGRVQYSRVKFQNAVDPQNANIVTRQVVVTANSWNRALCGEDMRQTVLLQDSVRDVLNPIWFKLTYELLLDKPRFPREGEPLPRINDYPLLDQNASRIFDVKFYKDCGANDVCESNLRLNSSLSLPVDADNRYVLSLGENNQIFLNLTLRNEHEAAYQTYMFVQHPQTLEYIGADNKQYACSHVKDIPTLIRCDIGNPFPRDGEVHISMRFNTTNLQPLDNQVSVSIWANTTSTPMEPVQPPLNLTAVIVVRADIEVRGASDPLEIFYSGLVTGASAMKREEDIGLSVNHTYEIRNRGPAKVSSSKVTIRWPLEVENGQKHGKYLLYLLEEPIIDGPVVCSVDPRYINPVGLKRSTKVIARLRDDQEGELLQTPALRSRVLADQSTVAPPQTPLSRVKREKIVQHEEKMVENKKIKYVRLDCDRGTAKCVDIVCQIRELNKDQPVVIRLRARLWNSTFMEDYRDINSIEIKSRAEVVVDTTYQVEDAKGNNIAFVQTVAKPDVSIISQTTEVAWWWILLAVLGGLLLLALLIYLLYCCGFFTRKNVGGEPPRRQTPSDFNDEYETKRMSPQSDE